MDNKLINKVYVELVRRCPKNSRIKLTDGTTRVVPTSSITEDDDGTYIVESQSNLIPLEKRIDMLEQYLRTVITGDAPSLFLFGSSGTGKTHIVKQVLAELKYKLDIEGDPKENYYYLAKGRVSAYGLYKTLYNHNGAVIVFDDSDDILSDRTGNSILKAALDSYDTRIVSWEADPKPGAAFLPRSFEFTGKVIFISNKPKSDLDPAVQTRCLSFELTLSKEEILKRMSSILYKIDSTLSHASRKDVLRFLRDKQDYFQNFSLRLLVNAFRLKEANLRSWKDLILIQ